MNETIYIDVKTTVKNSYGANNETFAPYKSTYASVKYTSGNVQENEHNSNFLSNIEFIIRYREDIDLNCQIRHNGNKYRIQFIEPIGRKDKLRLKCLSTHLLNGN